MRKRKRSGERAPVINVAGTPLGAVMDETSERDRVWFEEHPGVTHYTRPQAEGEFPLPQTRGVVWVEQIKPGVRIRVPLTPGSSSLPSWGQQHIYMMRQAVRRLEQERNTKAAALARKRRRHEHKKPRR